MDEMLPRFMQQLVCQAATVLSPCFCHFHQIKAEDVMGWGWRGEGGNDPERMEVDEMLPYFMQQLMHHHRAEDTEQGLGFVRVEAR